MTIILDTGALIAVERCDRDLIALAKRERSAGRVPLTTGGVIAQYWRGGTGRQAETARLLKAVETVALDDALARRVGLLLGSSATADVVDASIAVIAHDGDTIYTADPSDLAALAESAGLHVDIVDP
jgi:predicted nucleic acid-binding protein